MTLENEIKTRNKDAFIATEKIIAKYTNIFDEAFEYLSAREMNAEWVAIDFHPYNIDFINVVGVARYKVGSIIPNESDEVIYVDESNVNNYERPMRMIIPLELIELNDLKGIKKFLKEYSQLIGQTSQDEAELLISNSEFLEKNFSFFGGSMKKPKQKIEHEGFDLSDLDLDEVQIQQLRLLRPEGQS
jgi:hypothetical protein